MELTYIHIILLCFFVIIHINEIKGSTSVGMSNKSNSSSVESSPINAWSVTQSLVRKPKILEKLLKIVEAAQKSLPSPIPVLREPTTRPINPNNNAVIASAMATTYIPRDISSFVGTLRKTGYDGDIVLLMLPNPSAAVLERARKYNTTIFTVNTQCSGKLNIKCTIKNFYNQQEIPLSILRYFLYQDILNRYAQRSQILLTDFRDVLFQSNPWKYKPVVEMKEHSKQIMIFAEAYPNRVVRRCPSTASHILNCYGKETLQELGSDVITTSGLVFGKRNVLIAYSYLLATQADPRLRLAVNDSTFIPSYVPPKPLALDQEQKSCMSFGADMAFHIVLLHYQILSKYMEVRIIPQGEGLVNSVGGFHGENKLLQAQLSEWKILRGESPFRYVYNWNGEISPVIHQLDRYLTSELSGGYDQHLAVCQNLYGK